MIAHSGTLLACLLRAHGARARVCVPVTVTGRRSLMQSSWDKTGSVWVEAINGGVISVDQSLSPYRMDRELDLLGKLTSMHVCVHIYVYMYAYVHVLACLSICL